jgi:small-conductance mechanosensitive channel
MAIDNVSIKKCPKCSLFVDASLQTCKCGYNFETKESRNMTSGQWVSKNGLSGSLFLFLLGLSGSIILVYGLFVPIMTTPTSGTISCFENCIRYGDTYSIAIIILIVATFILLFTERYLWLWFTGLGLLGIIVFRLIALTVKMAESTMQLTRGTGSWDIALKPNRVEWGWGLLVTGAMLIIVTATVATKKMFSTSDQGRYY